MEEWSFAGPDSGHCYQFQTAGLNRTTPSKSAFITRLTLVLVPLFAVLPGVRRFGARAPSWNVWLGVLLAFGGVVLLAAPAAAGSRIGSFLLPVLAGIRRGDLLTLGCAFGFAFHIIVQDRFSNKAHFSDEAATRVTVPHEGTDISHQGLAPLRGAQAAEPIPFEHVALLPLGLCTLFMAITTPLLEKPQRGASRILGVEHRSGIQGSKLGATVSAADPPCPDLCL